MPIPALRSRSSEHLKGFFAYQSGNSEGCNPYTDADMESRWMGGWFHAWARDCFPKSRRNQIIFRSDGYGSVK